MPTHDELAVVCSLTPDGLAARKAGLLPGLLRLAISREDLDDGIRLTFPAEALAEIGRTIDAERQCCRFLRFMLEVPPAGGPITLALTGPAGTRAFLSALIQSADGMGS